MIFYKFKPSWEKIVNRYAAQSWLDIQFFMEDPGCQIVKSEYFWTKTDFDYEMTQ